MVQPLRITIATNPVAKGRPKMAIQDGKVWTYTPRKTEDAQKLIIERLERYQGRCFPKHIPVKMTVIFYRVKSKWLPKKESLPFRKPDLDNFLKLTLDAMNGILVTNDAQITSIITKKRWAEDGKGHINIKLEQDRDGKG